MQINLPKNTFFIQWVSMPINGTGIPGDTPAPAEQMEESDLEQEMWQNSVGYF